MDPLQDHQVSVAPGVLKKYTGEPPDMTPLVLVPGPITYSCKLHAGETGTINVP
jgi:hypothetical protein